MYRWYASLRVLYNETMKRVILISGLSGAGKTTITNYLEDDGYRCIDQFPPQLFKELFELIHSDNYSYNNIAIALSLNELDAYYPLISGFEDKPTLILVDANNEVIINRYKFSRRVHPLLINNEAETLSEAIEKEKQILEKFKQQAIIIDTSSTTLKQLKEKLHTALENEKDDNISLSFISFGFKNGLPRDADVVFDVRFLENPFYSSKLRKKTGNDKAVKEFVLEKASTKRYLKKLTSYLDFMLKAYDANNDKRHLTVCVGCTGGQHRSVVVANYLYQFYKDKYSCYIKHRELS